LDTKDLGKRVQGVAEPIARALGLELLEVRCQGKGAGTVICVTLDKEGGLGIRDCEEFHRSLRRALDVAVLVSYEYRLEVSSPGVDRPLKELKDFRRVVGRLLQVRVQDFNGEYRQVIGRLSAISESGITMVIQSGKQRKTSEIDFSWDSITEAKQEAEF
jgi:ribosome maturation factor RimP